MEKLIALLQQDIDQEWLDDMSREINSFISLNEGTKTFNHSHLQLFELIVKQLNALDITQHQHIILKLFQALRILTRSKDLACKLDLHTFEQIIYHLYVCQKQQTADIIYIVIEQLSIIKRLIYYKPKLANCFDIKNINSILDLINMKDMQLHLSLIDFINFMLDQNCAQLFYQEIAKLYYIGKMLMLLETSQLQIKIVVTNLLTRLLDNQYVVDCFRKLCGASNIIQEIQSEVNSSIEIKIPLLNCLLKISLDTKNLADLKMYDVVNIVSQYIKSNQYLIVTTVVHIMTQLALDDELLLKIMDNCLYQTVTLLFQSHSKAQKKLVFDDISPQDYNVAIKELQLYTVNLLRFMASAQKNRATFKQIFIPRLLQIFIDIGNFNKNIASYKKLVDEFNRVDQQDLMCMEESLIQLMDNLQCETLNKTYRDYIIIEQIGKGAFGSVFLCKQGSNRYALKQILGVELTNYREVEIHKQIAHPNIVKFYESFVEDKSLCLILEYVEGYNLSELIKMQSEKHNYFEEEQIWKIIIDTLSVLRYLHVDHKIVHRDLNPANIMITSSYNIKICDFGLAKYFSDDSINKSFVGTLIYTCPEIVENKEYSEKADIWSLGCIIYELIKLKPAFSSNNPLTLASKIVQMDYEPINNANYSYELLEFVSLCMQKDDYERLSVCQLIQRISLRIMQVADNLKNKKEQMICNVQVLTKKLNSTQSNFLQDNELAIWVRLQQILRIHDQQKNEQNENCFQVELFIQKVLLKGQASQIKDELQKLVSLSKEVINNMSITYEQLYFIVQQLLNDN